jgi:glutamine amidotransferase
MGWNAVQTEGAANLFRGIDTERGFYFLHSYFFDAAESAEVVARVEYGATLPCAIERANVFGVQFHPEKSHFNGGKLFANFAGLA